MHLVNIQEAIDETKDWMGTAKISNEKCRKCTNESSLMKTLPFKYEKISPEDKYF